MGSAVNQLTPIDVSDLTKLRDLYLKDWPHNCVGYYALDNFIRWLEKDAHIKNLFVFALNDDWSDGTFLLIDRYQLFLNTLNSSNDRLTIALSLLDWSRSYKVSSFLKRHRSAVISVVESKGLKKEYYNGTLVYHIRCDEAIRMEINCPDGMVVREMNEEKHASLADDVWPNQHEGSLFLLRRLIRWNANVGVFTKDNDELVAWCFRLQGGFLGALQVKDTHQRQGLGAVALRAMSKKIGEMGHDVIACVGYANIPSKKIFDRSGFKVIDEAYWLKTVPTVDCVWSDD